MSARTFRAGTRMCVQQILSEKSCAVQVVFTGAFKLVCANNFTAKLDHTNAEDATAQN